MNELFITGVKEDSLIFIPIHIKRPNQYLPKFPNPKEENEGALGRDEEGVSEPDFWLMESPVVLLQGTVNGNLTILFIDVHRIQQGSWYLLSSLEDLGKGWCAVTAIVFRLGQRQN